MSAYCEEICIHLDTAKKRCLEFKKKLAYSKYSGVVNYTVFEKCDACKSFERFNETMAAIRRSEDMLATREVKQMERLTGHNEHGGVIVIRQGVHPEVERMNLARALCEYEDIGSPDEFAELKQVKVKTGRWLSIKDDYGHLHAGSCSECGCEPLRGFGRSPWNYCPNCGAYMYAHRRDEAEAALTKLDGGRKV